MGRVGKIKNEHFRGLGKKGNVPYIRLRMFIGNWTPSSALLLIFKRHLIKVYSRKPFRCTYVSWGKDAKSFDQIPRKQKEIYILKKKLVRTSETVIHRLRDPPPQLISEIINRFPGKGFKVEFEREKGTRDGFHRSYTRVCVQVYIHLWKEFNTLCQRIPFTVRWLLTTTTT